MGKADVIQMIFDSAALVRAHYKEVALPLLVLLVLSGAGNFGGSSFSNSSRLFSGLAEKDSSQLQNSLFAAPLSPNASIGSIVLALGAIVLVVALVFLVLFIAVYLLNEAVWLYVYEHFYAILRRKKLAAGWKARMKRLLAKVAVLQVFWLLATLAVFALPAMHIWNSATAIKQFTFGSVLSLLGASLLAVAAGMLALFAIGFVLLPLWIFYAMDGLGFIDSLGKSFTLVVGNAVPFLLYSFISALLWAGQIGVSLTSCCFGYLVVPLVHVFLTLVMGITLMKMKLALEE